MPWKWDLTVEQAIDQFSLGDHAAEIDERGFTVIPPEKTGFSPADVDHAKATILAEATKRTGIRWDEHQMALDEFEPGNHPPAFTYVTRVFEIDQVFRNLQTNPIVNTLHRHIIGNYFRMRTAHGMWKWANDDGWGINHGLHTDTTGVLFAEGHHGVANCNWLLTDCEAEDGPICFLPGSHKFGKLPTGNNITDELRAQIRPIEAPAGSIVVFNSSTWHGSWPRSNPGLRITTHSQRGVPAMPLWDFSDTSENVIALASEPELFRMLCGRPPMRGDNPGFLPRRKDSAAA